MSSVSEPVADGDPHSVSQTERTLYYRGLPSAPNVLYRTGKSWPLAGGVYTWLSLKELREVYDHPITDCWNTDLGWKVVKILDAHKIRFTTIDVVRFLVVDDKVLTPVTIWIGVFPDSTSPTAAHNTSQDILALLKDYQIEDIDIDFRHSMHWFNSGPPLLRPVNSWDPLAGTIAPLTPALGLGISVKQHPEVAGTMALYLAEGGDSNKLLGLTCHHVLFPKDANLDYTSHPGTATQEVTVLGQTSLDALIDLINMKIEDCTSEMEYIKGHIQIYEEAAKGTDTVKVESAQASLLRARESLQKKERARVAFGGFLEQVHKNWMDSNNRVLGRILRSPPIRLGGDIDMRHTEDWALFEVDRSKLGNGFHGNIINLSTKWDHLAFRRKCFANGDFKWGFSYPKDGLLQLKGTISDELMKRPDTCDMEGKPCLLVVKRGDTTQTTIGRSNCVFSIVQRYDSASGEIEGTSMEWPILNYDQSEDFAHSGDSGSIIADIKGRIGGMLTGGCGQQASSDITYSTPFSWLLERIKAAGFPDVHLGVE